MLLLAVGKEISIEIAYAGISHSIYFCLQGNFAFFVVCFSFLAKSTYLKNYFQIIIRVSNRLDPDEAGHFVWPDLGPKYLQKSSR